MHPNECVKWYLAVLAVLVVPIRPPNGMSRWEHDPYVWERRESSSDAQTAPSGMPKA
jgi:hypothetical protein